MSTKVTVVIPCYNQGKYLTQSIGSIKKQSFTDWEIIIVNDGSTDEFTNKFLNNYSDPQVRIITTKNQGLPSARNTGIKHSTSEYILTLDADDYFEQTFLEKAVKILDQKKEFGVVTCMIQSFGKEHNIWTPLGGSVNNFLVDNNCGASCLFRRQFWLDAGGYFEEFKSGYEDWDFWISGTEKGWQVYVLQEILFFYRKTNGSMLTQTNKKRAEIYTKIIERHKKLYQDNVVFVVSEKEKVIQELLHSRTRLIVSYLFNFLRK